MVFPARNLYQPKIVQEGSRRLYIAKVKGKNWDLENE
jgi:hypothetical protein